MCVYTIDKYYVDNLDTRQIDTTCSLSLPLNSPQWKNTKVAASEDIQESTSRAAKSQFTNSSICNTPSPFLTMERIPMPESWAQAVIAGHPTRTMMFLCKIHAESYALSLRSPSWLRHMYTADGYPCCSVWFGKLPYSRTHTKRGTMWYNRGQSMAFQISGTNVLDCFRLYVVSHYIPIVSPLHPNHISISHHCSAWLVYIHHFRSSKGTAEATAARPGQVSCRPCSLGAPRNHRPRCLSGGSSGPGRNVPSARRPRSRAGNSLKPNGCSSMFIHFPKNVLLGWSIEPRRVGIWPTSVI